MLWLFIISSSGFLFTSFTLPIFFKILKIKHYILNYNNWLEFRLSQIIIITFPLHISRVTPSFTYIFTCFSFMYNHYWVEFVVVVVCSAYDLRSIYGCWLWLVVCCVCGFWPLTYCFYFGWVHCNFVRFTPLKLFLYFRRIVRIFSLIFFSLFFDLLIHLILSVC